MTKTINNLINLALGIIHDYDLEDRQVIDKLIELLENYEDDK